MKKSYLTVPALLASFLASGVAAAEETSAVPVNPVTEEETSLVTVKGTGVYQVTIDNIKTKGDVLFAVWSDTKGQDDIKWYNATLFDGKATGNFNVINHTGTGNYHIHIYQNQKGKMVGLTTTRQTVNQDNYTNMPYFNQRDERWGGRYYGRWTMGAAGCVPTALSMVFSALKNQNILPTEVADYLYQNTRDFNKDYQGTGAKGIINAVKAYGLSVTNLPNYNSMLSTLQEGHYVLAAVGNSKFVVGGTHELVLKGYRNGQVYVTDPYTKGFTGWYNLDYIFNVRSTDKDDTALGLPFFKISDI